jgi:dTDP-4-dehydrorhamnose 3,5-epimerase/CDP-3, 6-dideoxy-D-glycero-D-glycero-4-hexulose-5-epimerase
MKINNSNINGVKVATINLFEDNRGLLFKPFSADMIADNFNFNLKESWFTISKKNVIRGMHMQAGIKPSNKIVTIVSGEVIDVLLDTRKESSTFGVFETFRLSAENKQRTILSIPVGVAHGYKVIKKDSVVMYMADEYHHQESDIGYRWDSFGFDWGLKNPVLSGRDLVLPKFIE